MQHTLLADLGWLGLLFLAAACNEHEHGTLHVTHQYMNMRMWDLPCSPPPAAPEEQAAGRSQGSPHGVVLGGPLLYWPAVLWSRQGRGLAQDPPWTRSPPLQGRGYHPAPEGWRGQHQQHPTSTRQGMVC